MLPPVIELPLTIVSGFSLVGGSFLPSSVEGSEKVLVFFPVEAEAEVKAFDRSGDASPAFPRLLKYASQRCNSERS